MGRSTATIASLLACSLFKVVALASPFQYGDIFISNSAAVFRYDQAGTLLQTIPGGGFGLAFDSAGNLYVADGSSVQKYDNSGNPLGTFVSGFPGTLGAAYDVDFDSAGNAYVVGIQDGSNDFLSKYTGNGAFTGSVSVPEGQENWVYVDVAGNTVLLTPGTAAIIDKFDTFTLGSLGSFFNPGGEPNGDVEGLAGGGFLVISGGPVNQYNSGGTLTGTYNTLIPISGTWIGLDSLTATNFWAVSDFGEARDFNLGTSTPAGGFNSSSNAHAIAVFTITATPEPSTLVLFLSGSVALGLLARRRPPSKNRVANRP